MDALLVPVPLGVNPSDARPPDAWEVSTQAFDSRLVTHRVAVALGPRSGGLLAITFTDRAGLAAFLDRNPARQTLITAHADAPVIWFKCNVAHRLPLHLAHLSVLMSGSILVYNRATLGCRDAILNSVPIISVDLASLDWGPDEDGTVVAWLAGLAHGTFFKRGGRGQMIPNTQAWLVYLAARLKPAIAFDTRERQFYQRVDGREWRPVMDTQMTHHASAEPLPPSLRDPHIRRAYRYLQGTRDDQMAIAHALKASPDCKNTRQALQGFLCARDISLEGVALQLELEAEVVKLFAALFFNVRERGDGFRASVMFPETRIGAVVEAEKDFDDLERTLMRAGQDHGWREVARIAGLISMEDADESSETMLADMERTIAANARMLVRAGHLNRPDSPGIRHAKVLMSRPKPEAIRPKTDDDKVGLGSFGMKAPVLEHFRRIAEPNVQYRLALQRQQMMKEQEAETKKLEAQA